ncbi:monocarboxylate transporter [Cordyceps javanica]|uniref:Monocarboxylate transporter n=1 Tax=Cordyceps javanica TaxID=43265 RepID=A0A545UTY8_9HYPO|nr:monocarboxylate transporter [Cordyceps javanica]TQW04808.1 monocarboxylate transporter [Cordyceps javanica]
MAQRTQSKETLDIVSPRPISPDSPGLSSIDSFSPHEPHHIGVPDSGRRAWLVVLGGFINFTASFGLLNAFGTYESRYEESLQLNTSTITWIGSAQMFVLFLSGIAIGPAFDKWGSRKLMLSGTFLCLVSFIACSFATKFYQLLLVQGFLFGLGCALQFYPTTSAVSEWFDKKRGFALGLVVSGASAGGIIWPMLLNSLFIRVEDSSTHRITAGIATPLMLLSCVLVRERKDIAGHDTAGNEIKASQTSISKAIWDARFLGLSSALLFINCGMMVPFFYIPQYAKENGVDGTMANNLLAISYAASLVGRIFTGWVADHMGRFNMLLVISALTSIATLCFVWATALPTLVIFSLLFGFSSGGIVPLGSACVAQTTPDMGYIGLRIGVMMAICSVGTLAGGPATGAIKDATQQWGGVFIFCAALVMTGTCVLFTIRMLFKKRLVF